MSSAPKYTITPLRFPITASTSAEFTVKATDGSPIEAGTTIKVTQGTTMMSAMVQANGKVSLGPWKGNGQTFHPGKVQFQIVRTGVTAPIELPVAAYLYLTPVYTDENSTIKKVAYEPTWAGITGKEHVVAIGSGPQNSSYFIDLYLNTSPSKVSGQPFPNKIAAVVAPLQPQIYLDYINYLNSINKINLRRCPDTTGECDPIQTDETQVTAIAINPPASILSALYGSSVTSYAIANNFSAPTAVVTSLMTDPRTPNPSLIASGDFDGDGKSDLVVWDPTKTMINVLLQKSDGTSMKFVTDPGLTTQLQAVIKNTPLVAMVSADIDSDGLDDLVYATATQVAWITNQGPDGAGKPTFAAGGTLSVMGAGSLSLGNADGDALKLLDLVITQKADLNVRVYLNTASY